MELPVFSPVRDTGANCGKCSLRHQKNLGQMCFALAPRAPVVWNGIMIVGEHPDRSAVIESRPFTGPSGKLLRALCKSEGIELDECYLTHSALCRPLAGKDLGGLMDQSPEALHRCLPRLEREIQALRPRVILALGTAALATLTGAELEVTKREAFACDYCAIIDRKVSGVQCSKGDCQGLWEGTDDASKPEACPLCACSWKRLKVRRVRCPKCNSRKMRDTQHVEFEWDYKLAEVAGAVIPAEKHGWDEFGVKYIVATYPPQFLMFGTSEGSGEKKKMAGQFAAKTVTRHLRKALHLSKQDRDWTFEYELTSAEDDFDARDHLREYLYKHDVKDINFTSDIETKAWGTHYMCAGCEKKSGIEQPIAWETAPILHDAWCKKCAKQTMQTPTRGELDARKIENVTEIECIGFASRKLGRALVVDTRNLAAMPNLADALRVALTDPKLKKSFHHGTYDVPVIKKLWGYDVQGYCGIGGGDDTLMMHHVLCPDETHTLAHVAFKYTYARVWKPPKQLKGRNAHESFEELAKYNARDVWVTDEAREIMQGELERKGNALAVYRLDQELQEQALAMQQNGLPLDMDAAKKVGAEMMGRQEQALDDMRQLARNGDFNPNSPEQLREYLFEKQGYPVTHWTSGGKSGNKQASVAEDALVMLPDTPFKRALLEYREANTTIKSYFDISTGIAVPSRGLRVWNDGRIHATWKPFGTRSGRYTSNPNLQNVEKWMRAMVVAPKGRILVGADQAQLELRLTAALSGDKVLIDKCINADENRKLEPEHDPHSFVASIAFGTLYTNLLLKDPAHNRENSKCKCQTCTRKAYRDLVKRVIYGLNYGAGDAKVLEAIYAGGYNGPPISIEMIGRIRAAIFRAFAGIPKWRDRMVREANATRAVFSPLLGRWRTFPLGDIPVTEIYNFGIQSGGADIMNILGTKFYRLSKKIDPTSLYIAQVHDALYYEVADDGALADDFAAALTETLTVKMALVKGGYEMPFVATAHKAQNWMEAA